MVGSSWTEYYILERINRGGMADIFLAEDRLRHRNALRIILNEHRFRWGRLRQFQWGCEVMRQLDHPNVVRYHSNGKFRGLHYAVLEYIDGPNLRDKILRNDPQLRANAPQLLVGLAAGLAHIHERGFVHMDFKPENILIPTSYEPKIIDFDLAIVRPQYPRRISVLSGTPSYLAPEQLFRLPVDERADIFSYGITAYEVMTGRKPVTGETWEEIVQKYANFKEHIRPPRYYNPQIPASIEQVILKCLEKDPGQRYPSLALVVRDLLK
jgi:serine/threonine protein kinase